MRSRTTVAASALSAGLLLAGCTLGPTPQRADPPFDLQEPFSAALQASPASADVAPRERGGYDGRWWERFADETTSHLVEEALAANLDLQSAAARVTEARALHAQAFGARLPTLGASAGVDRRQQSIALPGGVAGPGDAAGPVRTTFRTTTYTLGVDAAWQADLWGRLRRAQQAAGYDLLATDADRQALAHVIIAETVRLRVSIATLQTRLELAEANLASLRRTLEVTESRYAAGVGDPLSVRLARQGVAAAEAQLPPLAAQAQLAENALAVLLGRRPGTPWQRLPAADPEHQAQQPRQVVSESADPQQRLAAAATALPPLPDLAPPPLALPAALLDNRPDLLASDLRARAAQARIGVAVADLLPNLTLGAGVGRTASEPGELFDPEAQVWNLLAGLTQPLFEGGRRRAGVQAVRARARAASADYAADILNAIREVEDALVREHHARTVVDAAARSLEEATAAEALARDRYGRGLSALLEVFEAEHRRREAEERLTLARQDVWNARIDLHLALGGDWE